MSTRVNVQGLRSANNIQRTRQRDNPGNKQKVRNQTARQHGKTRLKLKLETETRKGSVKQLKNTEQYRRLNTKTQHGELGRS